MKKIIDSKLYDTETAELVKEDGVFNPQFDFENYTEKFYKTKNGADFMYFDGAAASKYSKLITGERKTGIEGLKTDYEPTLDYDYQFFDDDVDSVLEQLNYIELLVNSSDFVIVGDWETETLIKTNDGNYYSIKEDGLSNRAIAELNEVEARDFVSEYGTIEQYISEFGEVEEA